MGTDPVFILLTILVVILIGYWMTHQARKKRRRPQTGGLRPSTLKLQEEKNKMIQELNTELDQLEAALQPPGQADQGPSAHVLKSLRLISTQLMQLNKRLEVLERKAADDRRLQQQYDKP